MLYSWFERECFQCLIIGCSVCYIYFVDNFYGLRKLSSTSTSIFFYFWESLLNVIKCFLWPFQMIICVLILCHCGRVTDKNNSNEEILFRITGWEVSVHSSLTSVFLGLGWGRASWQKSVMEQSCSPHGGHLNARKKRGRLAFLLRPETGPWFLILPLLIKWYWKSLSAGAISRKRK